MTYRLRAAALLQLDRRDEAVQALEESIRIARSAQARYELALSLDLTGMLGDTDAARESVELLAELGVAQVLRPPLG